VLPGLFRGKLFRQLFWECCGDVVDGVPDGGMFFITVNQVLVRLWARCGRKSDRMWSVLKGVGPPVTVAKCSETSVVYVTGLLTR
jgi:hypothetical protein